ncbi:MAG: hypothetical protein FWC26_01665, partial [Fibromonadales bacterium]|nr:hypothetical protein [Fibromonadales bacterium]
DVEDIKTRFVGQSTYPIIVKLAEDGSICGYKLESIGPGANDKAEGWYYEIKGEVICKGEKRDLSYGDSLSFNVSQSQAADDGYNNTGYALKDSASAVLAKNKKRADAIKMALNTNLLQIEPFDPKIVDTDPWKPPFPDPDKIFGQGAAGGGAVGYGVGGSPAPGLSNFNTQGKFSADGKVNTFGTVGNIIPANRTGELVLTTYPTAGSKGNPTNWKEVVKDDFFGLPPSANNYNGLYGIADPSKENTVDGTKTGGYPFVKNGFTNSHNEGSVNGTMQISPTRCVSTINGNEAKINCLNFNLVAVQPFQLSVTVYDQLGNFVTQYREIVTPEEFRYVTQGPNYIPGIAKPSPSEACVAPTASNYGDKNVMTTNGRVNVGVNIYPFAQNGRKIGNGVYILKVDRVDLPFEGCYNNDGESGLGKYPFVRYHADLKFGWMRGKQETMEVEVPRRGLRLTK